METSTPTTISDYYTDVDFYSNEMDNKVPPAENRHIKIPIVLIIVISLSLIGNILVAGFSIFYMRFRTLTSITILNLALSDLLLTSQPVIWVCKYFWPWTLTDAACKFFEFLSSIGFYSSMVFLVLMSVQRYMAVVHPHSGWKTKGCITCIFICAWVMTALAALPGTVHTEAWSYAGCMYNSESVFIAVNYEKIIFFVCAFVFMAFCYIRILLTMFRSPTNQSQRITGLAFILVATYFLFWAPYKIFLFLYILTWHGINVISKDDNCFYAFNICNLLSLTRCCLNPVIYGLFGLKFHKIVRDTILQFNTG